MSYYDDNDVSTWKDIDQDDTDIDAMVRLYVYDTVTKTIENFEENGDPVPNTLNEWNDIIGEEIAWDLKPGGWLNYDNFDAFCGRVDALLVFFLENYDGIKDQMIW